QPDPRQRRLQDRDHALERHRIGTDGDQARQVATTSAAAPPARTGLQRTPAKATRTRGFQADHGVQDQPQAGHRLGSITSGMTAALDVFAGVLALAAAAGLSLAIWSARRRGGRLHRGDWLGHWLHALGRRSRTLAATSRGAGHNDNAMTRCPCARAVAALLA